MTGTLVAIYIMTAFLSIAIAVTLVTLSRLSGQARIKRDKGQEIGYESRGILADEELKKSLFEEINEVESSEQRSREITDRVSDILSKKLDEHVSRNVQEIAKKYESVIREKSQNEEIAWKKYNKVLGNKRQTEAVIRSIAAGLVVIDAKGKVVMMNPAAEKLLSVAKKDKIGKSILENLKKEQLISLAKDTPGSDGEGREIEIISQKDETKKILRSSSAVIEDENGQTIGMVSILSDITKQKELDQMKADFISKVSHELRTPVVTVQNSLALLLNKTTGPLNEDQERFLTIAQRNLTRLARLVDDILDISKLEASKVALELESCAIEKPIKEACDSLAAWAESKNIKIEQKIQKAMPEIKLDFSKIIQVLNNLIGNAVKFTPKNGNITVNAGLCEHGRSVFVSVADNGIGIAKEDIGKVFNKFQQAGERAATDISGTGLGLYIAKEIVELHGGKIWVESEKGAGATFTLTLPITV